MLNKLSSLLILNALSVTAAWADPRIVSVGEILQPNCADSAAEAVKLQLKSEGSTATDLLKVTESKAGESYQVEGYVIPVEAIVVFEVKTSYADQGNGCIADEVKEVAHHQ